MTSARDLNLVFNRFSRAISSLGPKPCWRGNSNPPRMDGQGGPWRPSHLWRYRCLFISEINPSLETEAYQPLFRWRSARPAATIQQGKHSAKQNTQKYRAAATLGLFCLLVSHHQLQSSGDTSASQSQLFRVCGTICVAENSIVVFLFLKGTEDIFLPKSYVTLPLLDAHLKLLV